MEQAIQSWQGNSFGHIRSVIINLHSVSIMQKNAPIFLPIFNQPDEREIASQIYFDQEENIIENLRIGGCFGMY